MGLKISVVMPTYNRANLLANSVNSLMRQQRKPDEIIVIDDGSSDNTRKVVDQLNEQYNSIIRYFHRDSPLWIGPSIPLNIGIKKARYDLIVFSLSDTVHLGETLSYIEKRHNEVEMLYLIASTIYWIQKDVIIPQEYWDDPIKVTEMGCVVDYEPGLIAKDDQIIKMSDLYTSNIAACKTRHLFEVNGFDEAMTKFYGHEDSDITQRLYNLGIRSDPKYSDFQIIRDNNLMGIHQWHERPPAYAMVGVEQQRQIAIDNSLKIKVNPNGWGKL